MSLIIGMAVLGTIAMIAIWGPAYPAPDRHPYMRAMDELGRRRRCEWWDR